MTYPSSKPDQPDARVIIVGAGMTGLVTAGALQDRGIASVVVDQGQGVGGRMATGTLPRPDEGELLMDHGAQFITARDPAFMAMVDQWCADGVANTWCHGFADSGASQRATSDHPRFYGTRGMTSITHHLARDLDLRLGCRVDHFESQDHQWIVRDAEGKAIQGDALVLTPPLPQALGLLDASDVALDPMLRRELDAITYFCCIAVMAILDGPSAIPDPGAIQFNREPIDWIADNRRKGICPDGYGVTVHAAPGFSQRHFDDDPEEVADRLLEPCTGLLRSNVLSRQIHRWRFSSPARCYSEPCLTVPTAAPLVLAGDAFGGPRVEGAFLSGRAAAKQLATALLTTP